MASLATLLAPYGLVVPILFRRDGIVVVAKPAGLVVHRNERSQHGSIALLQLLRDQLGVRLNPVHRLDAGTSGCLLFAEDTATTAMLARALSSAQAQKTYYAMVRGNAAESLAEPVTISRAIGDYDGVKRDATTELWCPGGCFAEDLPEHLSSISPPGRNIGSSLVVAKPRTGRWHQIRKHTNGLSHPIINDSKHGDSRVRRAYIIRANPISISIDIISIYLYLYISISIYLSLSIYLPIYPSNYPPTRPSIYLSACLSIYLSIHPSIYQSIYLYMYLCIHIYIYLYLSIYLSHLRDVLIGVSSLSNHDAHWLPQHVPREPLEVWLEGGREEQSLPVGTNLAEQRANLRGADARYIYIYIYI